eukprot:7364761-Pyramimonas_sp.AAC.1
MMMIVQVLINSPATAIPIIATGANDGIGTVREGGQRQHVASNAAGAHASWRSTAQAEWRDRFAIITPWRSPTR